MGIRQQMLFFQKLNPGQLMNHNDTRQKFLFTKFEGCSWARKHSVAFLMFHTFAYNVFPTNCINLWKKI